jgi:hypothetical protein
MREKLPQVGSVYALPVFFGDYVLGTVDLLALRSRACRKGCAASLPCGRSFRQGLATRSRNSTENRQPRFTHVLPRTGQDFRIA